MDGIGSCRRCGRHVGNSFMVGVIDPYQLEPQELCSCPWDDDAVDRVLNALAQRGFDDLDMRTMLVLWLSPTDGPFDHATFNHHVGMGIGIASGRLKELLFLLCDAGYLRFDAETRLFEMTCRGRTAWLVIRASYT